MKKGGHLQPLEWQVEFRCGGDGTDWKATLGPVGPKVGVVRFSGLGKEVKLPSVNKAADLRRKLDQLMSSVPSLPPPPQAEIVDSEREKKLAVDSLTWQGFVCPSCSNTEPLICPVCSKLSCRGGRDSAGRVFCQWCGSSLVLTAGLSNSDERPPQVVIDATAKTRAVRYRELKSGE